VEISRPSFASLPAPPPASCIMHHASCIIIPSSILWSIYVVSYYEERYEIRFYVRLLLFWLGWFQKRSIISITSPMAREEMEMVGVNPTPQSKYPPSGKNP
jgi:hypothetical protein